MWWSRCLQYYFKMYFARFILWFKCEIKLMLLKGIWQRSIEQWKIGLRVKKFDDISSFLYVIFVPLLLTFGFIGTFTNSYWKMILPILKHFFFTYWYTWNCVQLCSLLFHFSIRLLKKMQYSMALAGILCVKKKSKTIRRFNLKLMLKSCKIFHNHYNCIPTL